MRAAATPCDARPMALASTSTLHRSPRRVWRWVMVATLVALLLAAGLGAYFLRAERWSAASDRTTMELVRYAERRLSGHPRLQRLFRPVLDSVRRTQEREPPPSLPSLGKGQQSMGVAAAGFEASGRPIALGLVGALAVNGAASAPAASTRTVRTSEELVAALAAAKPGQTIELAPGRYPVAEPLRSSVPALPAQPITVRAAKPGSVELVVTVPQGIVVSHPHWVFENLDWRGACERHDDCEHAFHLIGRARGTVILNNRSTDFNVHVRAQGLDGEWPDDGLIQFSSLSNTAPRLTRERVSLVDLIGVRGWQIVDNLAQRSLKAQSDRTSYGFCLKGAGGAACVERNLVVCSPDALSQPGLRVGISLGCGTTGPALCRDGRCDAEDIDSVIANNVVAHCNDFGVDLNRARGVVVAHNTLVNTEGIDARHGATRAAVAGNLIEGRLRSRDGASVESLENLVVAELDTLLAAPLALDLRWLEPSDHARRAREVERDFCGQRRPPLNPPGATISVECVRGAR
jgi:hypothetical protein